jgi:hypothetical protein
MGAMAPDGWSRLMLAFLTPGRAVDGRRVDGSDARGAAALPGEEFVFREAEFLAAMVGRL